MILLQTHINEGFNGEIWKFIIDPDTELLYTEVRNAANKQASFAAVDLKTGKTNFINLTQPENWLIGLEACFNEVVFLHGYESAQSPVHKGLTAINGITAALLWSNYTYAIRHISINGPIVYSTQVLPQKLLLVDAKTGSIIRSYDAAIDLPVQQNITLPFTLPDVSDDVKPFLKGQITGNIHYMEYNNFRIVSLHSINQGELQQILFIFKDGSLVFEDLLNDKIQKLQPEAFIMHRSQLIFIKNKTELKVLNL